MLRLVATWTCPYVHRCRTLFEDRRVPHVVEHIDLKRPPFWFSSLNTSGKVPVLIDGDTIIEDSTAIMTYVDARWGPHELVHNDMHAQLRKDLQLVDGALASFWRLQHANHETVEGALVQFQDALRRLSSLADVAQGPDSGHLSMLDCAAVALLVRLNWIRGLPGMEGIRIPPQLDIWATRVCSTQSAKLSTPGAIRRQVLGAFAGGSQGSRLQRLGAVASHT